LAGQKFCLLFGWVQPILITENQTINSFYTSGNPIAREKFRTRRKNEQPS
jgi:hypothetical protein